MFARPSGVLAAMLLAAGAANATLSNYTEICKQIGKQTNDSWVVYPPLQPLTFTDSILHWFSSSNEVPACVFKPETVPDLSVAMQIIASTQTPFAIYSGGHASNPGFSSTKGVHISMGKFNQIILSEDKKTVEIGFGNAWSDVYSELDGTGVNVVGGRVSGPGVGGFTLGGGFSWKTNQYGLTCDTVRSFNVLLPNGTATVASATQNPDLFFALKGGMNKFGIVTSAIFETHPQTDKVWGGLTIYTGDKAVNQVLNATTHFSFNNKDPKAQIITTMEASATGNSVFLLQFYDGPEKPAAFDIFDELVDAIPVLKTTRSQSFKSFINGFPSPLKQLTNWRGAFITISTSQLTPNFLEAIRVEAEAIGKEMIANGGNTASFDIEPFTNYGQFATESAYPHADSPMPLNLYFAWFNKSDDEFWYNRMKQSVATLKAVAEADGIFSPTFTIYPNYALFDTPAAELYGTVNAARLRAIRAQVDPTGIMDLAGGFQI